MEIKITKEVSNELLGKVKELKLEKFYNFDQQEFAINTAKSRDELKQLLIDPKPLISNNNFRLAFKASPPFSIISEA